MARRDQQIDASNFVYSIDRKIAPFLIITASKRAPHGSGFANRRKKGVRIPPVRGKQWLASIKSSVNFRAKKARKRLMPLAFRQWHLYRFDFMVPVVGVEPTRYCYQRILSPSRLPIPTHRQDYTIIIHAMLKIKAFFPGEGAGRYKNSRRTLSGYGGRGIAKGKGGNTTSCGRQRWGHPPTGPHVPPGGFGSGR